MSKPHTEELVYTEAEDRTILAGMLIQPTNEPPKPVAVIWIPGLSINFYHPSFIPIGREFARLGYAFLIVNTRGHDLGNNLWRKTEDGDHMERRPGGALWELFEESPLDIAAWIDFAEDLGFQRVVLLGHSFGGMKVVYYQAQCQDPRLAGLVLASSSTTVAPGNPELVTQTEQMVAEGRGEELLPWGSISTWVGSSLSAQTYLSRHNIPNLFERQKDKATIGEICCPLMVCYGTQEGFDPSEDIELIRRNATASPSIHTILFEGANHGYDNHQQVVAAEIIQWIDSLSQT